MDKEAVGIIILELVNTAWRMRRKQFYYFSAHADDILSNAVLSCLQAVERFNPDRMNTLEDWLLYTALQSIGKSVGRICNRPATYQYPLELDTDREGGGSLLKEAEFSDLSTIPYYEPLLDELAAEADRVVKTMKPVVHRYKLRRLRNAYRT